MKSKPPKSCYICGPCRVPMIISWPIYSTKLGGWVFVIVCPTCNRFVTERLVKK